MTHTTENATRICCFKVKCSGSSFTASDVRCCDVMYMQLFDWDEHIMLISHTVNLFGNNLLVIGNTGSNSTKEALHATEQGFNVGMHASLQINPYYGKTSATGVWSLAHWWSSRARAWFFCSLPRSAMYSPECTACAWPGLLRHFEAVLDEGPAIVYNVPGRCAPKLDSFVHDFA
jgi:4-hydroxy-tetrahydrodipicolinate synthase